VLARKHIAATPEQRPLLTQDRPVDRFILMINDLAVAHAVHVLGVAHWIGGVANYGRTAPGATLTGRECGDCSVTSLLVHDELGHLPLATCHWAGPGW
jgi:hypothetical protein